MRLWSVTTAAPLQTLEGHDEAVYCVGFSADGSRLASGSKDMTVKVWHRQ